MKLHLACGDIYLWGYQNIDIGGLFATECTPELVEANMTTLDNYFKYPFGSPRRPVIMDHHMDLTEPWCYGDEVASEIVMISAFEHVTRQNAIHIVKEVSRVLKHGGKFIVDFPDIRKDYELYYDSDPEFFMELVYCNHKNEYSVHRWGYTPDTFRSLWGDQFIVEEKSIVEHAYPMTGMVVTKQ
jgi:SAM-dependent methyltransferase